MLLPLAVAGASLAALSACGNDVPPGAVAKVGDDTITQDEFTKWLTAAVKSQSQGGTATVPDPPDYTKCVAAKKKQPVQGQGKQTDASLKKQCKSEYTTLKRQVMQFLIQASWVEQESEKQNIKVTDAELHKTLEEQKKRAFPNEKAYQKFIKTSGMSEADILFRVKLAQLQEKLTKKVTNDAPKVTDADVEEYYNKHKDRFAQPERRDLRVVLTKTQDKANAARDALEGGQPWKDVAKQYSIDETSKAQGGKLASVAKGQQDKALDAAVFSAQKGELKGPVKTQFGWYVFEVEKITPANQQSLDQSRDAIKSLLEGQRKQKALDAFIKDFRDEYKDKTHCADDYRVAECANAPKDETDTGPSGSAQPQPQPGTSQTTPQQ